MFKRLSLVTLILYLTIFLGGVSQAEYKPFEVKLTLFERLIVLNLLPAKGDFLTLKVVKELQMELAPSDEEIVKAGLEALPQGGIVAKDWNVVELKVVVMGDTAKGIIVTALKKLEESKELKMEQYSVYEKFVLEIKEQGQDE